MRRYSAGRRARRAQLHDDLDAAALCGEAVEVPDDVDVVQRCQHGDLIPRLRGRARVGLGLRSGAGWRRPCCGVPRRQTGEGVRGRAAHPKCRLL